MASRQGAAVACRTDIFDISRCSSSKRSAALDGRRASDGWRRSRGSTAEERGIGVLCFSQPAPKKHTSSNRPGRLIAYLLRVRACVDLNECRELLTTHHGRLEIAGWSAAAGIAESLITALKGKRASRREGSDRRRAGSQDPSSGSCSITRTEAIQQQSGRDPPVAARRPPRARAAESRPPRRRERTPSPPQRRC